MILLDNEIKISVVIKIYHHSLKLVVILSLRLLSLYSSKALILLDPARSCVQRLDYDSLQTTLDFCFTNKKSLFHPHTG